MNFSEDLKRLLASALRAFPQEIPDVIEWAHKNVLFPGSARSKHFNISITPWLKEPLQRATDLPTRIVTLMKPVQSGGSAFGEVMLCFWIMFGRKFLQYNWSSNKRADERWASRIDGILKACAPIRERLNNLDASKGEIDFGNVFLRNQGVFNAQNLDSDSIRLQINEEVHSWEPGHLKKARNRFTAVWDYKSLDISNSGSKGDQLDQAFNEGTVQHWEVKCPSCKLYHRMVTKYDERQPHLGGLRYDAEGCRRGNYEYDYNKLRPTVQFQMPCGHLIHNEDTQQRRALSLSGRYSEPDNKGAELQHRSYTYQAVSVDYIDWMVIIKDKHDALRSRSMGDIEPWRRYKCERECIPYDQDDVPLIGLSTFSKGLKKSREGLPDPKLRLFALDRQQGEASKREFSHWWLVIRDHSIDDQGLKSLLVYEGKLETDEEVIKVLDEHKCKRWQGVADSGDDTTHVYLFCLKYGINAIKGGKEEMYAHEGGVRRIFSPERPLHSMINRSPNYPYLDMNVKGSVTKVPDPREPMFWLYSKSGIRERFYWIRGETRFETPEDVSEEYKSSMESEERITGRNADGSVFFKWIQHKKRNDQFVNECYIAMQVDQAGMILSENSKQQKNKDKK